MESISELCHSFKKQDLKDIHNNFLMQFFDDNKDLENIEVIQEEEVPICEEVVDESSELTEYLNSDKRRT